MYAGSDSFRGCHWETLVSLPPSLNLPPHVGNTCQKLRQDFQSSLFLLPYLHLLSVPVIQTPFQGRAAALTSLPQPFPALCSNPADPIPEQLMHLYYIIMKKKKKNSTKHNLFPLHLKSDSLKMSTRPECIGYNEMALLSSTNKYAHWLSPSVAQAMRLMLYWASLMFLRHFHEHTHKGSQTFLSYSVGKRELKTIT